MRSITPLSASAFAAGLLFTGAAFAATAPTYPVHVQESELNGYDFEFVIHNCIEDTEITGIYFEDGWEAFFSDDLFDRNLRIDSGPLNFLEGTVSPDLDPWSSSTVSYEVPSGLTGVGDGGTATIAFVNNGFGELTAEQIEEAINTTGFGIGLMLTDADGTTFQFAEEGIHENCDFDDNGDGGDDEGDEGDGEGDGGDGDGGTGDGGATGVPSPSAALMGLALIGMVGQRRRRNA